MWNKNYSFLVVLNNYLTKSPYQFKWKHLYKSSPPHIHTFYHYKNKSTICVKLKKIRLWLMWCCLKLRELTYEISPNMQPIFFSSTHAWFVFLRNLFLLHILHILHIFYCIYFIYSTNIHLKKVTETGKVFYSSSFSQWLNKA